MPTLRQDQGEPVRLRFPKAVRLTRAPEFARLKREGTSTAGRYLVFSVLAHGQGPTRVGFITTRRIGNAVERNLLRRRLRELFRTQAHTFREGMWLVVIARHRAAQASFAELAAEWAKLAERAGLRQPPAP
jgi:ribonuclease P protein component